MRKGGGGGRREVEQARLLRWLTEGQAAKRLGITHQAVSQRARNGTLRYVDTAHGRLFDPEDVERVRQEREERQGQAGDGEDGKEEEEEEEEEEDGGT